MIDTTESKSIRNDDGKITRAALEAGFVGFSDVVAWRERLDAIMKSNMILLEGGATWSNELIAFVNAQCQQHLERPQALSKCSSPADAVALHVGYMHRTTEQYLEQLSKFLNLAASMCRKNRELLGDGVTPPLDRRGSR